VVAVVRGALTALASAVLVTLGTYQQTGRWTPSLVAGGISLATVVVARVGFEGTLDARAALRTPPAP
jgi:hypothetical protein